AEVARRLSITVRGKGQAFRHGGEEFVLILPNFTKQEAIAVAERARIALESEAVNGTPVTASFGVATFPDDAANPDNLLSAADGAMYDAKRRGRNLVRAVGDPEPVEQARIAVRRPAKPGQLGSDEKEEMRIRYFREGVLGCPRDGV